MNCVWQAGLDPDAGLTDWRLNLKHSFVAGKNSPQKIDFTKTNQNLKAKLEIKLVTGTKKPTLQT